jgi:hypothetical protein
MSWRSVTFATPPVLTQDSQGPQTAVPPHAKFGGSNGVHKAGYIQPALFMSGFICLAMSVFIVHDNKLV